MLKCFKCSKELEPYKEGSEDWIQNGMRAYTSGGYGSRVFDSLFNVSIVICDVCFVDAANAGEIQIQEQIKPAIKAEYVWRSYDPETDDI